MLLNYEVERSRNQCAECGCSLKGLRHPVILRNNSDRMDLCEECFQKISTALQYLAFWNKRSKAKLTESEREKLEQLTIELFDYFHSAPELHSIQYKLAVLKLFYLERMKFIKEWSRAIENGKIILCFHDKQHEEIHCVLPDIEAEEIQELTELFAL